ncbi:MAG: hypothetical protein HY319_22925 [Armatimonadetes bacterium]|nr:hypothetical protein [Armatimonadota bacterium]
MTEPVQRKLNLPERPQAPTLFSAAGAALGFLLGTVIGPLLGLLTGLLAGCGVSAGSLFGGPAVWIAEDLRADLRPRFLSIPLAMLIGAAVGLLVGPVWFCFLGYTAGRDAVEAAWRGLKAPSRQEAM